MQILNLLTLAAVVAASPIMEVRNGYPSGGSSPSHGGGYGGSSGGHGGHGGGYPGSGGHGGHGGGYPGGNGGHDGGDGGHDGGDGGYPGGNDGGDGGHDGGDGGNGGGYPGGNGGGDGGHDGGDGGHGGHGGGDGGYGDCASDSQYNCQTSGFLNVLTCSSILSGNTISFPFGGSFPFKREVDAELFARNGHPKPPTGGSGNTGPTCCKSSGFINILTCTNIGSGNTFGFPGF